MKKFCRVITPLLIILLIAGITIPVSAREHQVRSKIRVGYFSFSSFQEIDSNGNFRGYGYEYLQEIAKYAGWDYEYVFATWDECIKMLENGEIDLLGSAQRTPEREEIFDYPESESGISYAVLCTSSKNTDLAYEDFEAFNGMKVGVLNGNSRNDRLDEYCIKNNFAAQTFTYNDQEALLDALHSGQIDTVLTSNLRKSSNERIIIRFAPSPFYFVTTKGNEKVLDKLNYAQTQIKLTNPNFDTGLYHKYYSVDDQDIPAFTRSERRYAKESPTLKAVYNPNLIPISYQDADTGKFSGIVADLFKMIEADTGLAFTYLPVADEEKAAAMVQSGEADLICGFLKDYSLASEYGMMLTNPYLTAPNVMLTAVSNSSKNSNTIALTKNFLPELQRSIDKKLDKIQYYDTPKDCLEALYSEEVSSTYLNTYTANLLRSDSKYARLSASAMVNMEDVYCIAMSTFADPQLLSILNKSLQYVSPESLETIIKTNTVVTHPLTIRDIIYQRPISFILTGCGVFLAIILLLVYIFFLKGRSRKRIYDLLYFDPLTKLWNFNKFQQEAAKVIPSRMPYALIYTDIERFKFFNDVHGYAAGDNILQKIAQFLRDSTRQGEMYARISADNFVALFTYDSKGNLLNRLRILDEMINSIPKTEGENYRVPLASGIYILEPDERNISHCIDCANEARKTIKGSHKSGFAFYNDKLKADIIAEREIGEIMVQSLEDHQFVAYYQPKYNLQTSSIVGAEALVRWNHPERGTIPPCAFVPIFEKNGFILDMDFYIFESVCQRIRNRLDAGKNVVPVSSNFSRLHLRRPDFCSHLKEIIDKYSIPSNLVELEITESTAQENEDFLVLLLSQLKSLGFSIAMDDFGTGYSSLNLLKKLPVDTLKLDKEFLQKGYTDGKERIVIEGFVTIAARLNMEVVCEGVETQSQAEFLRSIGCNTAQGYYYAKPMPLNEYEKLLNNI